MRFLDHISITHALTDSFSDRSSPHHLLAFFLLVLFVVERCPSFQSLFIPPHETCSFPQYLYPQLRRAPRELPESSQRAPRELPESSQRAPRELPESSERVHRELAEISLSSLQWQWRRFLVPWLYSVNAHWVTMARSFDRWLTWWAVQFFFSVMLLEGFKSETMYSSLEFSGISIVSLSM